MANRRKLSSSFKAKVALEALKELESLSKLSSRFEVSQEMISRWKSEFLKLSSELFDKKPQNQSTKPSEDINRFRAKVGELTMERYFLKDGCRRSGLSVK